GEGSGGGDLAPYSGRGDGRRAGGPATTRLVALVTLRDPYDARRVLLVGVKRSADPLPPPIPAPSVGGDRRSIIPHPCLDQSRACPTSLRFLHAMSNRRPLRRSLWGIGHDESGIGFREG